MNNLQLRAERLRGIISTMEEDPWFTLSRAELREFLSDDNLTFLLVEIDQLSDLRKLHLQHRGSALTSEEIDHIKSYTAALNIGIKNAEFYLDAINRDSGLLAKAKKLVEGYERRIQDSQDGIHIGLERLQNSWDALNDKQRRAFGRPKGHAKTALDLPRPYKNGELASNYPERSAEQEVQLEKLKLELANLERELGENK